MQAMAALIFTLQDMLAEVQEENLVHSLKDIQTRVREQIQVLRSYSVELRPPLLTHLGLEKAISAHVESFREKHPEIKLRLELQPTRMDLTENAGLAL